MTTESDQFVSVPAERTDMGDPKCKCIFHEDTNIVDTMLCEVHPVPNYLAPSPARDDAETVKLTDDEWRSIYDASSVHSGDMKFWSHHLRAAIESILAAHMAAPDELTAPFGDVPCGTKVGDCAAHSPSTTQNVIVVSPDHYKLLVDEHLASAISRMITATIRGESYEIVQHPPKTSEDPR